MNILRKKEVKSEKQILIDQLTEELRHCEKLLKNTEMLFQMTVDEDLIEARIYELKSLAKVQDHLICNLRQLMGVTVTEKETVNV